MLGTLRQYVADGRMSDDESVAIVANGLTETLLTELDDNFGPDAGTINDAIERVREQLRREHIKAAESHIQEIRLTSDNLLEAARAREQKAAAETALAQQAASEARAQANKAQSNADGTIDLVAHTGGQAVRWTIVGALAIGTGFAAASIVHSKHPVVQWIITGTFFLTGALSFFGTVDGTSAKSIGDQIENWIAQRLRRKLT